MSAVDIEFTNRIYKKYQSRETCTNFEPKILFDEFKLNKNNIKAWHHHCDSSRSFKSYGTDVAGKTVWLWYDRNNQNKESTEWVERKRIYVHNKGTKIVLYPKGAKAKKIYEKPIPGLGTKLHRIVLRQGEAYMEIYYRNQNGTYSYPQDQFFRIGQGKFYK